MSSGRFVGFFVDRGWGFCFVRVEAQGVRGRLLVGTGMLWMLWMLGVFGSEVLGLLVFWFFGFLLSLIRTEGFPRVYVGLLGYFFWDAGFLSSPPFRGTFGFSLFFSRFGGSGVLSHGAGFGLGFHG